MNKSAISNLFSSQTITPASWLTIVFSLVLAFAVGLFIAFVYRKNYRGVMYSNNFVLTLVMMTLITCPVVMCIKESIQLSMGMVGALSIVRFRTAVKEPLDTAYMFWALTMGILLGAGQFLLTVLALVMIAGILTLEPELLIADEATSMLDVTTQAQILRLFQKLRKERGLSLLLISHDRPMVDSVSDRIYQLTDGKMIEDKGEEK